MIVLIVGDSGVGKTTIASKIKDKISEVNLIKSYTTRPKRNPEDDDHIFIFDRNEIDDEIVASTIIDGNFYCALKKQFKHDRINLYIVDDKGIIDVKNFFKNEKIITIHIIRDSENINVSKNRKNRKIRKFDLRYDMEIYNNGSINQAVDEVIECIKKC